MSLMEFVDIHSHVLYGLDDGAKTAEDSVDMLRLAASDGTTDIVATPHANGQYAFDPQLIEQRIAELSGRAPIRIHRGCDFHLQFDNIQDALAHPDKYTVNHRGYLLVEFPDLAIFANTERILSQLLDGGMMPIITHPERNDKLQRRVDDVAKWVEMGCYVQVTAGSCTGTFGKDAKAAADALFKRGLVHFVASDAHDTKGRPPTLSASYASLANRWGEDAIQPLFVDHPRAVLIGEQIELDFEPAPVRRRKWYHFWG
jgi:protein-tyrosine phosphatase